MRAEAMLSAVAIPTVRGSADEKDIQDQVAE
jgi:hypothetical protein